MIILRNIRNIIVSGPRKNFDKPAQGGGSASPLGKWQVWQAVVTGPYHIDGVSQ